MLIKGLMRRTAQDVIDVGLALICQKNALPLQLWRGLRLRWVADPPECLHVSDIAGAHDVGRMGG